MAIASLPWYDLPEIRDATDAFWRAVARALHDAGVDFAPVDLERTLDYREHGGHPNLMFTQVCGYDVALDHGRTLRAVAAPAYVFDGCSGHDHCSFIVVRDDTRANSLPELAGLRAVINNLTSHSGNNALRATIAPLSHAGRFFSQVSLSGSHEASLRILKHGLADVACVDCVTWGLLSRHRPAELAGIRVVARTALAPVPPYVTSMRYGRVFARKLRNALMHAIADGANRSLCDALGISGVTEVGNGRYDCILEFERTAVAHGYTELPRPGGEVGGTITGVQP